MLIDTVYKRCYDIRGSYNNGVEKYLPGQYLPIYDGRENIDDYSGGVIEVGEYLCDWYGMAGCVFKNQWVNSIVVKELLRKGLLKKSDIIKQHLSNRKVSTESFVKFTEYLYQEYPKETAKRLFCQWYGTFNSIVSKSNVGVMTTDLDEISALYNKYGVNMISHIQIGEGLYCVSRKITEKHHYNHSPIYNAIIGIGQLQLLTLREAIGDRVVICSSKTDSYNVCSNSELPELDELLYKNDTFNYRPKLKLHENPPFYIPNDINVAEYSFERDHDKSFFISAPPGVGKSTAIAGITRNWELVGGKYIQSVVLCFTHAVIDRLAKDDSLCSDH